MNKLDQLSRLTWQGHAAGAIADADAQHLAEQIHHRRQAARGERKPVGLPPGRPSIFPPKRVQRSPDRAASIQRRRSLAASGPMPPTLACRFTTGELAVLRIVADAVRDNGQCVKSIPEIAARAGVCRTTAQNASLGVGQDPAAAEPAPASRPKPKVPDIVHTSLYVPKAAYRKLQEIALVQERKVHDVIMDGIDTVLQEHGHAPTERRKRGAKAF